MITGASSGIGRELTRQLAGEGHTVIAVARDQGRLSDLAKSSPGIDPVPFDLANTGAVDDFVAAALRRHPRIDGLINNAAIQENVRMDDASYDTARVQHEIAVNLATPIALTRSLLPHFQARSAASIVNITSGLGFVPKRTSAVYSATKAGLHLFSEGLRVQLKGSGVRVIEAVMPMVDTPMTRGRGTGKITAGAAARAVIAGVSRGQERIYVGKARALPLVLRVAPSIAARIMQRM